MQKYVNNDSIRRGEALSPERVLPEDFGSSQRYQPTKKADVFAVGTVCWQVRESLIVHRHDTFLILYLLSQNNNRCMRENARSRRTIVRLSMH